MDRSNARWSQSHSNLEEGIANNGVKCKQYLLKSTGSTSNQTKTDSCCSTEFNHIAIGCYHNDKTLYLVKLLSKRLTRLTTIQVEQDDVVISGQMFGDAYGSYAFRICDISNIKKDVLLVGPEVITYDAAKFSYIIRIKNDNLLYGQTIGEIYLRNKPQVIP